MGFPMDFQDFPMDFPIFFGISGDRHQLWPHSLRILGLSLASPWRWALQMPRHLAEARNFCGNGWDSDWVGDKYVHNIMIKNIDIYKYMYCKYIKVYCVYIYMNEYIYIYI